MLITPNSKPNWRAGLFIVLLSFCVWKIESDIISMLSLIILLILIVDFISVSFLLFQINIYGLIKDISIEKENKVISDIKNEKFEFHKISYRKIPFNNLYIVRFSNEITNKTKKVVLNETELLIIKISI